MHFLLILFLWRILTNINGKSYLDNSKLYTGAPWFAQKKNQLCLIWWKDIVLPSRQGGTCMLFVHSVCEITVENLPGVTIATDGNKKKDIVAWQPSRKLVSEFEDDPLSVLVPRGIGWRGRWEGGSGWGTHVNPWLFHFNVWQNPLQ